MLARATIWSYLDALMAITGAGGAFASAFYRMADDSVDKVLRSVVGLREMAPRGAAHRERDMGYEDAGGYAGDAIFLQKYARRIMIP